MNPSEFCVVICNTPGSDIATQLAEALLDRQLAACVNIFPPVRSIYRWEGKIEQAEEVPLLIKTRVDQYAAVQDCLSDLHPYTVPEIIALPLNAGLPAYLGWVQDNIKPAPQDGDKE